MTALNCGILGALNAEMVRMCKCRAPPHVGLASDSTHYTAGSTMAYITQYGSTVYIGIAMVYSH